MPIGYLFENRLLRFKEDSTFLLLRTNAAICEDFWLPKNISMCCIKFHLCKKLKTGQVRFIRVMKEKKIFLNHYKARKAKNMACAI